MTHYSVGLLAFALAHRGTSGSLPAATEVDEQTRFYWLEDKNVRGLSTKRMVWICDMAAEQLSLYERHVQDLENMLPDLKPAISAIRQEPGLPLFSMKQGKVEPINAKAAIGAVMAKHKLRKNAGRHWLRAQLVGQCSTETFHAFGHLEKPVAPEGLK